MTLLALVLQVMAVVLVLHAVGLPVVAGRDRLREAPRVIRRNARTVGPTAVALAVVLALNGIVRDVGIELSWLIGLNLTSSIHALEGRFVADLQSLASPELTAYFSFVYVFGYVFLLTFPVVLYAFHDDARPLYTTLVAYSLNYGIGLLCYVLVVAYGPRNFMPELVESLLFTTWPRSQLLTSQVNVNTNVFPSLHTSLATTVALLAARFRGCYPRWVPIAWWLAASVAVATMYLGIHWLTDVVAGIGLAVGSVAVAARLAPAARENRSGGESDPVGTVARWLR